MQMHRHVKYFLRNCFWGMGSIIQNKILEQWLSWKLEHAASHFIVPLELIFGLRCQKLKHSLA